MFSSQESIFDMEKPERIEVGDLELKNIRQEDQPKMKNIF